MLIFVKASRLDWPYNISMKIIVGGGDQGAPSKIPAGVH